MLEHTHISVPPHPFWGVFRRFGRDESIAMIVNVLGTWVVSLFFSSAWVLSLTGPAVEKLGFFPAHFWEARQLWLTTPRSKRHPLRFYLKRALKGGGVSLAEDVLVHDPLYILLMLGGLALYPGAPAWLLAGASFIVAVFGVAGLELGVTECRYWLFKRRLASNGFSLESYYEARFLIAAKEKPSEALGRLVTEFGLNAQLAFEFRDSYFDTDLPTYAGRTPRVRLRECHASGAEPKRSIQVTFTRAAEQQSEDPDQHRYFPIRKDKMCYHIGVLTDESTDTAVGMCRGAPRTLEFRREFVRDDEILASADQVSGNQPYWVLELKARRDIARLVSVMRFIMTEFPVVQTTCGKEELMNCGDKDA